MVDSLSKPQLQRQLATSFKTTNHDNLNDLQVSHVKSSIIVIGVITSAVPAQQQFKVIKALG
jgi:hypothetical protein